MRLGEWVVRGLGLTSMALAGSGSRLAGQLARECDRPRPEWIWCDDFEEDRLGRYFEFGRRDGRFARQPGVGFDGSTGMTAQWDSVGRVDVGFLHLAFGKTPGLRFRPVDSGQTVYREIYWRFFLRNPPDWIGGGGHKLTRAIVFASAEWATAAVAHVWSGGGPSAGSRLRLDPASGTDRSGRLVATRYNDSKLRWLGARPGARPIFGPGEIGGWHCLEVNVRLNDPGGRNGIFRLWLDDVLDAEREGLDWVGRYSDFGINAVFLENYWNGGAPAAQERYFDRLIVSTERIGCGD